MKRKQIEHISNIMSKRHRVLPETLPYFFQMQKKLETCRNSNLTNFRRPSFGNDIHVIFIS